MCYTFGTAEAGRKKNESEVKKMQSEKLNQILDTLDTDQILEDNANLDLIWRKLENDEPVSQADLNAIQDYYFK